MALIPIKRARVDENVDIPGNSLTKVVTTGKMHTVDYEPQMRLLRVQCHNAERTLWLPAERVVWFEQAEPEKKAETAPAKK